MEKLISRINRVSVLPLVMLTAILSLEVNADFADSVVRIDGENCPAGSRHITFEEAEDQDHRQGICGLLDSWDIAKIGGGGSMRGSGYQCEVRQTESAQLVKGHSLCVSDISPKSRRRELTQGAIKVPKLAYSLAEFESLLMKGLGKEASIILWLLPVEELYKAWQMGDRERFKKLLTNPFYDSWLSWILPNTGINAYLAALITDELFPKESSLVDNCSKYDHDFLLMEWIKIMKKFPLEPKDKDDYHLIRWIHEHLASKHPKLTPSIEDMQSDNPTQRIEAQLTAFFLLLQEYTKQSIPEERLIELLSKNELSEAPEALLGELADSLCMDKQELKDFLHQLGQAIDQQGQKNRQAFEGKYQPDSESIKPLFVSKKAVRNLVVRQKDSKAIQSTITIAQDSKTVVFIMQERNIHLVWTVQKTDTGKVHLGLMIDGQPIENALAKYHPNKDRHEISSVLDGLKESIKTLVAAIDNGLSAEQQQAYKELKRSVGAANRSLFCPPRYGRRLEGGGEGIGDESCNVPEDDEAGNTDSTRVINRLQEDNIEIETVQVNNRTSDTGRESTVPLNEHQQTTLEQAILDQLGQAHMTLNGEYVLDVSANREFTVRSVDDNENQIDTINFRLDISNVRPEELDIGTYSLAINTDTGTLTIQTCAICMDYLQEEQQASSPCESCNNNQFHQSCIDEWLVHATDRSCPLCRQPLPHPVVRAPADIIPGIEHVESVESVESEEEINWDRCHFCLRNCLMAAWITPVVSLSMYNALWEDRTQRRFLEMVFSEGSAWYFGTVTSCSFLGWLTEECLDRCCSHDARITGCYCVGAPCCALVLAILFDLFLFK